MGGITMTILAFWPVLDELGWERHQFDGVTDEDAFKTLWENRNENYVRLYDIESHVFDKDTYGLNYQEEFGHGDIFEEDYNDEELDGGLWCKVLHVPSDYVKQVMGE